MHKESTYLAAYSPNSPVLAIASTEAMAQEQRWRCKVCGQEMGYSQPISLQLACALISAFIEAHRQKCGRLLIKPFANAKLGQPVRILPTRAGQQSTHVGRLGYLNSPDPAENGYYSVTFMEKPPTKYRDAETTTAHFPASQLEVEPDSYPPKDYHWHFKAKRYRYVLQRSGAQPQQQDGEASDD